MRLRDLDASLLAWYQETSTEIDADGKYVWRDEDGQPRMWRTSPTRDCFRPVATLAEAHGIRFLCPKSYAKNGGKVGTHSVRVYFTGSPVPPTIGCNKEGQAVRWAASGSSLDDLVLTPSIQEQDDEAPEEWRCMWHGFVGSNGVPPGEAA